VADHFVRDRFDDVVEAERAFFLGHARVIDDLQQQIAELATQLGARAGRDSLGDFLGFLDGVRRDRLEGLLEVPRAAAAGRAQRPHNGVQCRDGARIEVGRVHGELPSRGSAGRSDEQAIRKSHKMYYGIFECAQYR
jgi:hypothetical protein